MAAFVSLVNSRRRSHGKPNMGWINPFLYTYYASYINDINTGDNKCSALYEDCYYNCYYYSTCCSTGFYATSGWDPVTGLGSVNFDAFLATAMSATSAPTQLPTNSPVALSSGLSATSVNVIIAFLTFFFGVAVGIGIFNMWIAKRTTQSVAHESLNSHSNIEVEMSSLPVESNVQDMSNNNEEAAV